MALLHLGTLARNILKALVVLAGVFVTAYLASLVATHVSQKGPRIEVAPHVRDFGNVSPGQHMSGLFTIRNTGDDTLIVSTVKSSCGCTSAVLSSDIIAPGQTANLFVETIAARYRKPIDESIVLVSNDVSRPPQRVFLKGQVETPIDVFPPSFNYGLLNLDDLPAVRQVRVGFGLRPAKVGDYNWKVECSDLTHSLSATVMHMRRKDDELIVVATVNENAVPGALSGFVKLIGRRNELDEICWIIPCIGSVLGPIGAVPGSIIFDWTHEDVRVGREYALKLSRKGDKVYRLLLSSNLKELVEASMSCNEVRVRIMPKGEDLNKSARAARVSGTLWLLDGTDTKVLSIPILIVGK